MSSQTIQTMPFTQIIAIKSYLDNLGKPLNSNLNNRTIQISTFYRDYVGLDTDILIIF